MKLALLVLSLLALTFGQVTKFYPYNSSQIIFKGRYYVDSTGLRFDWPCSAIDFCFVNATKVTWRVLDTFGHYNVTLNGNTSQLIKPKTKMRVTLYESKQVTQTKQCISVTKITQDHFGPLGTIKDAIFVGIQLQGPSSPKLVPFNQDYRYKFEFIGDSITTAFGTESGKDLCWLKGRGNENCLQSWAHHLSVKLNADYRIQAESGKGVVKNAPGIPNPTMSVLYNQVTSNSKNSYSYQDGFSPDVIFVKLGDNDYTNLIKPSEKSFIFGYEKLLINAATMNFNKFGTKPKIITVCFVDNEEDVCRIIRKAVDSFKFAYNNAYYVQVPKGNFKYEGCINHLSVAEQRKAAQLLYPLIEEILQS